MKKTYRLLGLVALLLTIGCGAVPDLLLDEVRNTAKEAVEEQIDELVGSAIDDLLDASTLLGEPVEDVQDDE